MENNTFVDNLIEKIKYSIPRLTNLFSSVIEQNIENISIVDGKIKIIMKEPLFLEEDSNIFLQGIKIPLKISDCHYENNTLTFKTSWYHHLLVKNTKKIQILSTDKEGFSGEFELLQDIDEKTLKIKVNQEPKNLENCYLIRYHNDIINGFRIVERNDDYSFYLKNYNIKGLNVELNIFKECLEYSKIAVGCRLYKCFDLEDAINFFNNFYTKILNTEEELYVKDENCLTAFIEPPLISSMNNIDDSCGTQNFSLNVYIFTPLKIKTLEGRMANISDNIISTVNNVFNRAIGNKIFIFDSTGLVQKNTSLMIFKKSEPAIQRDNSLYIHKITYDFSVELYEDDFDLKEDYFRLNRLIFSSYNKKIDTKF